METVLRRTKRSHKQGPFCRFVTIALVIFVTIVIVLIINRFSPSVLSAWPRVTAGLAENGMYITLGFMALAIIAWNLCLHDRAVADERLIINDDELRRDDLIPWLSLATDTWGDFGRRRWHITKQAISKIVVNATEGEFGPASIHIFHTKGRELLFPGAWEYQNHQEESSHIVAAPRSKEEAQRRLSSSPLVRELVRRGYPVEFPGTENRGK